MAGGDVGAFAADLPHVARTLARILNHMHPAILQLRRLDAPIVAAVNGSAAGAGLSLVLGADYVIAKASSKFVLAYDKLGASPDCGGSWFLARRVGRSEGFRPDAAGWIAQCRRRPCRRYRE
jgi:2-(1,2-epoxy-1,2-dihydrophenyl)acetyl-CoA isomerase